MRTAYPSLVISSALLLLAVAAPARTRPHYGGTLHIEKSSSDVSTDNTALVTETLTSVDVLGRVQPLLAERWESQNGDRRWQFWIRSNVKFQDGTIMSAQDVADVLGRKQGAPWRTVRANGASVTLECDDPQPLLAVELSLGQFAIAKTDAAGLLVGTGPFRNVAQSAGKLSAFDDYWQGRPYVDSIETTGGRGLRDQWMDLGVARADVAEVPAEQIRHAQQDRMRTLVSRDMELIALVPSANSQALQDQRMRQAISAAVDRTSLLNFIFQKQGEVAAGILPNWMTGYDFLFPASQNLALARELRGQLTQGGAITIGYEGRDGIQQLLAERVALNARDAGITMQAVPNGRSAVDLELVRVELTSTNPSLALHQVVASFLPGDTEPVADDLDAIYSDERELLSDGRVIPLLYVPRGFAASSRVRNWTLNASGSPDVEQLWLEERR